MAVFEAPSFFAQLAGALPDRGSMTDLELLTAELERQNRELDTCFEQMRALDPELIVSVSPEWIEEIAPRAEATPAAAPAPWAMRA